MNKFCSLITTGEDDTTLSQLILAKDNTMGPMGSGGYEIRLTGRTEGAIHIRFNQMDCSPSPNHLAFIKDGKIWTTYMKGWIMEHLANNGISFSCERVGNPTFIEQKMLELQAV